MKTFSSALNSALSMTVKEPVWLLKLELVSFTGQRTLYLSDRPYTLWSQSWLPLVIEWGGVDRYFDPSGAEVKVSDVTIKLDNRPGALGAGTGNISWYFRKYDMASSTATLHLWLSGASLTEPSGTNTNDLLTVITGAPELADTITPALCPLDIVAREGRFDDVTCPWGSILKGTYTRNQWGSLPEENVGKWKPAVFGDDVPVEGIALVGPARVGKVEGPAELFDPAYGAYSIQVSFPDGGEYNNSNPVPAPCDMYLGDWRFSIVKPPTSSGASWVYTIDSVSPYTSCYAPAPMLGTTPLFVPSGSALWPRSDESGLGPYATDEPPRGAAYQFYHGPSDTGNSLDGYNPGRSGSFIGKVFADGVEVTGSDAVIDDLFGIAWLRRTGLGVRSKVGNPVTSRIKWTSVHPAYNEGDTWMRADQLTAKNPYGYNADRNPCILGDFAVPASGGGAPASSKLGLMNSPRYPSPGARMASVRFVMRYTGVETAPGVFHVQVFGNEYSFDSTELADGSGISSEGWSVAIEEKGQDSEIWPNNNGFPYTSTSPDPRMWNIYELSRDVTPDAFNHLESFGGFEDSMRAWFTGTVWPATNSVIVLGVELEIEYEPVESAMKGPQVTAIIGGASATAGEILSQVIPATQVGSGFDDVTLPQLKYRIGEQMTVCRFADMVTRESNTMLSKNFVTGKWDLARLSDTHDNANPPAPGGGQADVVEDELLADEDGLPMIGRSRSAPETVVNEVTVSYVDEKGKSAVVTMKNQGSIDAYGVRSRSVNLGAGVARRTAEDHALEILNEHAETSDYYTMTFPLGPKLSLEPNDILQVSAGMDNLDHVKMRVVSVEVDPGSSADGRVSTVTVNARRYSTVRKGFGGASFGQVPFGSGQIMEN